PLCATDACQNKPQGPIPLALDYHNKSMSSHLRYESREAWEHAISMQEIPDENLATNERASMLALLHILRSEAIGCGHLRRPPAHSPTSMPDHHRRTNRS